MKELGTQRFGFVFIFFGIVIAVFCSKDFFSGGIIPEEPSTGFPCTGPIPPEERKFNVTWESAKSIEIEPVE